MPTTVGGWAEVGVVLFFAVFFGVCALAPYIERRRES